MVNIKTEPRRDAFVPALKADSRQIRKNAQTHKQENQIDMASVDCEVTDVQMFSKAILIVTHR